MWAERFLLFEWRDILEVFTALKRRDMLEVFTALKRREEILYAIVRLETGLNSYNPYLKPWGREMPARDHGRRINVANVLFDALGISDFRLIDISHIIHILKCLLLQLLFRNFSMFPDTIRPRCTTMPWSIWPALVVLWGVCWMFCPPQPDKQSKNGRTDRYEIGSKDQDIDTWSGWESVPVDINSWNSQFTQQYFAGFEGHFQDVHHLTESPWISPLTDDPIIAGDVSMNMSLMSTGSDANYPAINFEAAKALRPAEHPDDTNYDSHEFSNMPPHLEPEIRESLPCNGRQGFYVASATSPASAESNNFSTADVIGNENTKHLDEVTFTAAEENVDHTNSGRINLKSRINKTQGKQPKGHNPRFPCDVEGCNLTFPRRYELDRHKKDVHGEGQSFSCPKIGCKYSKLGRQDPFRRKDKLKGHINNVHPDLDLASIPELQQPSRPTMHFADEDEPTSQGSTTPQSRKRRISPVASVDFEAQESPDTEVKRLRRVLEDLKEENCQMKDRHEREIEDLKDQNRWLRKMFEEAMKRTGG